MRDGAREDSSGPLAVDTARMRIIPGISNFSNYQSHVYFPSNVSLLCVVLRRYKPKRHNANSSNKCCVTIFRQANVPSYVGMPWEAFGCDKNGYGPSSLPRLADRATYIRHELLMRAVQVYDGDLVF